jgi:hydrogenase expression/formation protein HypC
VCLAIPGQIVEIGAEPHFAKVEVSGVRRKVNVDLLENQLALGDWVLIHVGFAMSRISAEDAAEQMRLLTLLGEATEAVEEVTGYRFDPDGELVREDA